MLRTNMLFQILLFMSPSITFAMEKPTLKIHELDEEKVQEIIEQREAYERTQQPLRSYGYAPSREELEFEGKLYVYHQVRYAYFKKYQQQYILNSSLSSIDQ